MLRKRARPAPTPTRIKPNHGATHRSSFTVHRSPFLVTIETDRASLLALKRLGDYAPANPAIRVEAISALEAGLRQAEEAEILARKALAAARDARDAAGWELHNAMLSAKATVIGQYGANSNAVQALGLKKKADYRRPARRRASTQV